MEFRFTGPLKSIGGERLSVAIDRPLSLRKLLGPLSGRLKKMIPYGEETTEAQLLANLSFFKNNRMIRIDDPIEPDDAILVILPPTGG